MIRSSISWSRLRQDFVGSYPKQEKMSAELLSHIPSFPSPNPYKHQGLSPQFFLRAWSIVHVDYIKEIYKLQCCTPTFGDTNFHRTWNTVIRVIHYVDLFFDCRGLFRWSFLHFIVLFCMPCWYCCNDWIEFLIWLLLNINHHHIQITPKYLKHSIIYDITILLV